MAVAPPGSDDAESAADADAPVGDPAVDWVASAVARKGSLSSSSGGAASRCAEEDDKVLTFPPAEMVRWVWL